MQVSFTDSALEDLEGLPRRSQQRIVDRLEYLVSREDPLSLGKPLTGHPGYWRFRAGDYRIVAQSIGNTLLVHLIAKRDSVYKGL